MRSEAVTITYHGQPLLQPLLKDRFFFKRREIERPSANIAKHYAIRMRFHNTPGIGFLPDGDAGKYFHQFKYGAVGSIIGVYQSHNEMVFAMARKQRGDRDGADLVTGAWGE